MDEAIKQFEAQFRHAGYLMVRSTCKYLEQHGLSMSRFLVLVYVKKHAGLTMGDLKQSMLLSG
ncbi:MAG TPA: MarR family transcriptional regulator, partial [bacterium]|nr:MarR family transcriptional regulator [bacterium]